MSRHSRVREWTAIDQNPSARVEQAPGHRVGLVEFGHGAGALLGLDGGGRVPGPVVATPGADRAATGARVVRRGRGETGRPAASRRPPGRLCPPVAVDREPVAGDPTGPGPRCHHRGHPLHGVWPSASSIAAVPCPWPGPSCQPTSPRPGAATGCGGCARCAPPSPRAGRSSCWPIAGCMPAGCAAYRPPGLASLLAHQRRRDVSPHRPRALLPVGHVRAARRLLLARHRDRLQKRAAPLPCTLLAGWEAGYTAPWLILTDVPPEASTPAGMACGPG